jgi:hypothetical protein
MSYRIIYGETATIADDLERRRDAVRAEEFLQEHEALGRARELLDAGEHHGVAVRDDSGNELSGVRLQLKLGFTGE